LQNFSISFANPLNISKDAFEGIFKGTPISF
jgi:hypothetical protein